MNDCSCLGKSGADGQELLLQVVTGHRGLGEGDPVVVEHWAVNDLCPGQGKNRKKLIVKGGESFPFETKFFAFVIDHRRRDILSLGEEQQDTGLEVLIGVGDLHEELGDVDDVAGRGQTVFKRFHGDGRRLKGSADESRSTVSRGAVALQGIAVLAHGRELVAQQGLAVFRAIGEITVVLKEFFDSAFSDGQ